MSYVDEIDKFKGNQYTAFGTAVHTVCESIAKGEEYPLEEVFLKSFDEELDSLGSLRPTKEVEEQFRGQGLALLPSLDNLIEGNFPGWSVFSTEEELLIPISNHSKKFKGFVDLVLKKDNKYIILDWKTCSWGWDSRKRTDKIVVYQLMLYKNFFAQKHNIPLENIETFFGLLKRTAKRDNVEVFKVTSGPRRIDNAMSLLNKALSAIDSKFFIKNKLSCRGCQYYKTEHCP